MIVARTGRGAHCRRQLTQCPLDSDTSESGEEMEIEVVAAPAVAPESEAVAPAMAPEEENSSGEDD